MPGAVAPQGTGSTHYNGMPGGTINPTIDGVNNSSNGFKSGGTSFFGTVPARLGAIEEVTVETAGLGGDAGVTGGVNLKFVTRRGTNGYRGSVFEQYRTEKLNANSFFNNPRGLPKAELRRHDFGGNIGGPIISRQAVLLRELRAGVHPADGQSLADAAPAEKRSRASSGTRRPPASNARSNVLDIAGAERLRYDSRSGHRQHPVASRTARGSTER